MRTSGILLHISSLPSDYGTGSLGKEAYDFIDFLKRAGQEYWQFLPIGPTGYGDSPYQSYSAFAGNPPLIDFDILVKDGLISDKDKDLQLLNGRKDFESYEELLKSKLKVLSKAARNFITNTQAYDHPEYNRFCSENAFWLDDYALFMSLKAYFKQIMWTEWDDGIRLREKNEVERYTKLLSDDINEWKFIQYIFFKQYHAMKKYANKRGIKLFGDMPIYVSPDSSDIWASPELFMLDGDRKPVKVAGCPPDDFSPAGQLWGNPLYDWKKMKEDGYRWWISRIEYSSRLFDLTRIDHFRGFESFYAIPAGDKTAENGEWLKGPSMNLFRAVKKELPDVKLVAEDLGFLTGSVRKMLKKTGYPGMNVLEFGFNGSKDSCYLPHNYIPNSVTYIGTHDNDTAIGWYKSLDEKTRRFADRYMALNRKEGINWGIIRTVYQSVSELVIIQMQDFLGLDGKARMNIPSTVGNGNWLWRLNKNDLNKELAKKIHKYTKRYFRLPLKRII